MITQEDQLKLFEFLSKEIKKDISCWAFGGTAMMFWGYKEETKDIDLLFDTHQDRDEFIDIINEFKAYDDDINHGGDLVKFFNLLKSFNRNKKIK